ncbi:MAG: hypothetical protein AAFV33_11665 [Chloroflexota bacterium]
MFSLPVAHIQDACKSGDHHLCLVVAEVLREQVMSTGPVDFPRTAQGICAAVCDDGVKAAPVFRVSFAGKVAFL